MSSFFIVIYLRCWARRTTIVICVPLLEVNETLLKCMTFLCICVCELEMWFTLVSFQ